MVMESEKGSVRLRSSIKEIIIIGLHLVVLRLRGPINIAVLEEALYKFSQLMSE